MRNLLSVLALSSLVACSPSSDEPDGAVPPDSSFLPDAPPDGAYSTMGACTDEVQPAPAVGRFRGLMPEGSVTLMSAAPSGAGAELTFTTESGARTLTSPLPLEYWTQWVGTSFDATRLPFGVQLANDEGTVLGFLGRAYDAPSIQVSTTVDVGQFMVDITPESCWIPYEHPLSEADCGIVPITPRQASIDGTPIPEGATILLDGYAIHNELIGRRGDELYWDCLDPWATIFVFDFVAIRAGDAG